MEDDRKWSLRLVAVSGEGAGSEVPVLADRLTVGRGPGADLCFDDEMLSVEHAAFEQSRGGLCVVDLESCTGTWVNGERVRVCSLSHGDRIAIGRQVLELRHGQRVPRQRELPLSSSRPPR